MNDADPSFRINAYHKGYGVFGMIVSFEGLTDDYCSMALGGGTMIVISKDELEALVIMEDSPLWELYRI